MFYCMFMPSIAQTQCPRHLHDTAAKLIIWLPQQPLVMYVLVYDVTDAFSQSRNVMAYKNVDKNMGHFHDKMVD